MGEQSLDKLVTMFLIDIAHPNRSSHTRRAYATDLAQLRAYHQGAVQMITANEHLTIVGKRGKRRTILLDNPHLVQQLRVSWESRSVISGQRGL